MRINAYVLAADPTWLHTSVGSYYDGIDRLVVSYDSQDLGWTGEPVSGAACRAALEALDTDGKIEWQGGSYHVGSGSTPEAVAATELRQRTDALTAAARDADWVLQIDTDEVLPRWAALREWIDWADAADVAAIEWPMRVLYRRRKSGSYLEVATTAHTTHYEYPGPIAVRPGVRLADCRRTDGLYVRPVVNGDRHSLQLRQEAGANEIRRQGLAADDAIWHNSWGRSPASVRRKVASWGHNHGASTWVYYYTRWRPAPLTWRWMRRFHPLTPPLWDRLAPAPPLPFRLDPRDARP